MDQFKEFQGKNLDECIAQACSYFDCPREKLEVEIIQDAKTGIFGIVGARKAKIRARRVRLEEGVLGFLGGKEAAENSRLESGKRPKPRQSARQEKPPAPKPAPEEAEADVGMGNAGEEDGLHGDAPAGDAESYPATPFEQLDADRLKELALDAAKRLIEPIAGREVVTHVDLSRGRVRLKVDWEGDAGLLIGREGMTLAALQYLISRILSRAMNAAVRAQLEIGDYKSRQDEKLKEIAKALAEKARQTGRPWSTRPLSSYHRRIIHMALQDEPGVMTRSSGDGPLKRVIIAPRRDPA